MKIEGVSMTGGRQVSLFRGRYKYIYGIDGNGRGFRWDGAATTAEPIGLVAPAASVSIVSAAASTNSVVGVNIDVAGGGYFKPPTVAFKGGGLTFADPNHARGQATLRSGGVGSVLITSGGTGYTSPPRVEFSGGKGSGAAISIGVDGGVQACRIKNYGSGYTNGANVSFGGVTGAVAVADIEDGRVTGIRILNAGTGSTTTAAVTISAVSGGTGAEAECIMSYSIASITVTSGGTAYAGTMNVVFSSLSGSGGAAYCTANRTGQLWDPVITSRGAYEAIPTVSVGEPDASATALIRDPMKGSYRCCIRYVDATPEADGGPIPSNITDPITVDSTLGSQSYTWTWSNSGADARAAYVELWRTSSNQAIVLYRVAKLPRVDGALPTTYTDSLTEEQLLSPTRQDYGLMPITLPSGQLNAKRFSVPPTNMEEACWFQDRAWYGVNTDGTMPNTLLFSEIDEPESVPDVNELIIQENTGNQDRVVGLIPFGAMLVVAQETRLYRVMYVSQPVIDASVNLLGYRGLLNKRCWSTFDGSVFGVDSFGMYAFDGSSLEPISAAVDNYWRDGIIDFTKSKAFFVQADQAQRVVRFHYCKSSDGVYPTRALCYSLATKAWWEEVYGQAVSSAAVLPVGGRQTVLVGTTSGSLLKAGSGLVDATAGGTTSIPYELLTGPLTIINEPTRQVGVLYTPTAATADLVVRGHFNGSATYRPNAIDSDRGEGVKSSPTGTVIDMRASRSPLGDSTGYATVRHAGRASDWSSGGDRHLAVDLSGTQSAAPVKIHGVTIGGVTT